MAPRREPPKDLLQQRSSRRPPRSNSFKEKGRKRGAEGVDLKLQKSSYFEIRALVHQLRPQFIEALRTPDFRNCKAAHEIRKQMKAVMDFAERLSHAGEGIPGNVPSDTKRPEESMTGKEYEPVLPQMKMSYISGNSAYGLNFITFTCRKEPVYYGETKESYRSRHKKRG